MHSGWLDNATLAALIGAVGAFFLVVLTDWRRNRRIATKQLPALLRRLLVLVDSRHEGALEARDSIREEDPNIRPTGNIGLPFPLERIERYAEQAGDRLTDRQTFALGNIAFGMREADGLNAASRNLCHEIDRISIDPAPTHAVKMQQMSGRLLMLKKQYGEEAALLTKVREIITAFLEHRLNERGGVSKAP